MGLRSQLFGLLLLHRRRLRLGTGASLAAGAGDAAMEGAGGAPVDAECDIVEGDVWDAVDEQALMHTSSISQENLCIQLQTKSSESPKITSFSSPRLPFRCAPLPRRPHVRRRLGPPMGALSDPPRKKRATFAPRPPSRHLRGGVVFWSLMVGSRRKIPQWRLSKFIWGRKDTSGQAQTGGTLRGATYLCRRRSWRFWCRGGGFFRAGVSPAAPRGPLLPPPGGFTSGIGPIRCWQEHLDGDAPYLQWGLLLWHDMPPSLGPPGGGDFPPYLHHPLCPFRGLSPPFSAPLRPVWALFGDGKSP